MKITVEFDINMDIQKVIRQYGKAVAEGVLNVSVEEHLQKVTEFLKDEFEDDCTVVEVNDLTITKNEKGR